MAASDKKDLKSNFEKFIERKQKELEPAKNATQEFLIRHNNIISFCTPMAKAIGQAVLHKSPIHLAEGLFGGLETITEHMTQSPEYYLTLSNGWKRISFSSYILSILSGAFYGLPEHSLSFKYEYRSSYKWYRSEVGEFAVSKSSRMDSASIFYRGELSEEQVGDWLAERTIKTLPGNVFYLHLKMRDEETTLTSYPINRQKSANLDKYVAYIKRCMELKINRSFIFYGQPGTGKSSLAHSIIDELGLRTLIFKNDGFSTDVEPLFFFIKKFGVECCLLDDFDTCKDPKHMLELLERMNRDLKLVIGLVNTMQDFHPAVIRPSRFDEFVCVEKMDEEVVRRVLGSLADDWYDRVKDWPIAFVEEFSTRRLTYPNDDLVKHFEELNKRVEMQLEAISKPKEKKGTKDTEEGSDLDEDDDE